MILNQIKTSLRSKAIIHHLIYGCSFRLLYLREDENEWLQVAIIASSLKSFSHLY